MRAFFVYDYNNFFVITLLTSGGISAAVSLLECSMEAVVAAVVPCPGSSSPRAFPAKSSSHTELVFEKQPGVQRATRRRRNRRLVVPAGSEILFPQHWPIVEIPPPPTLIRQGKIVDPLVITPVLGHALYHRILDGTRF